MYRIGVDLGGTHIAAGIVKDGSLIAKNSVPTPEDRDFEKTVKAITQLVFALLKENGISLEQCEAVGVGSPGVADGKTGDIIFSTNFGWHNVPLARALQQNLLLPVKIANDADAAGWAEYMMGAGRNTQHCATITLGTGVGGGFVIFGKLFPGGLAGGAELGHVTLVAEGKECTCGKKGCCEAYCSATGLINETKDRLAKGAESILQNRELDAKAIIDAAKAGDELAVAVFDWYIEHLAHLTASIINLLSPEVIAFGGGVSKAGEFLLEPLRSRVAQLILNKSLPYARIVQAQMGNDAGIIGAALL